MLGDCERGIQLEDYVRVFRYEDDIFLITGLCRDCTDAWVGSHYSHPFECEEFGMGVDDVSWMDLNTKENEGGELEVNAKFRREMVDFRWDDAG